MPSVEGRDAQGEVLGQRELPDELFGGLVDVAVLPRVVVAGAAARGAGTHSTKTRGEGSGGGGKPWRQKGPGRARQGSIRSPHWAGGGVAHGPKPRDYEVRVNKKMRRAARPPAPSGAPGPRQLARGGGRALRRRPRGQRARAALAAAARA